MLISIKPFNLFAFLFLNLVTQISGTCLYNEQYNDRRLVLQYENEKLLLLRDTKVADGTILYLVCNSNDITEVTCENGQFKPQLPSEPCSDFMMPQLKLENDNSLCEYNLYHVGYQIHCKNRDYFFDTYKVCFDFNRKRAVFTINEAYPFVKSRPRGMQFDPDDIFTMNIFSAYNKRDIYATFRATLGEDQTLMPNNAGDERFDRGHLAPVADYMTNSLIASTFKMVNVIPQFHTINDGNWKRMEEWVRNPINTPAKVCSGAFSWVLKLPDTKGNLKEMYLRGNIIPIPLWTFKIVLNRSGIRTVFLQYNNIHDKQTPPQIPNTICQPIACPSSISLVASNYYGYTYCCEPDDFLTNSVPSMRGHC